MSAKSIIEKIQKKWDMCSRKRKTPIIASFCIAIVLGGIGVAVIASSKAFNATQSQNTSRQIGNKETLNTPLIQASDTSQAQAPVGKPSGEDQPEVPANDQQGNQGGIQQNKGARPQENGTTPQQAKPDHGEHQAAPVPDRSSNHQVAPKQAAQEKREQKHEIKPQPSQPQPANPPAKKRGHWETVVEKPAWDELIYETVTDYNEKEYYVFNYDGYRTASLDDAVKHEEKLALSGKSASSHVESVKEPIGSHKEQVDTIHHEAVTRQVWVED